MVAVRCLDWPSGSSDHDFDQVRRAAEHTSAFAPRFGSHSEWYYRTECASWPYEATNPPGQWNIETSAPVLVVGGLFDPATPYTWAVQTVRAVPGAILLTHAGDGHGAAVSSECVRIATGDYLVDPAASVPRWCDDESQT